MKDAEAHLLITDLLAAPNGLESQYGQTKYTDLNLEDVNLGLW
jgi:hypothetical protein